MDSRRKRKGLGVCDLSNPYAKHDKNPIYRVWKNIKTRCYCKTHRCYRAYGGRGITVCNEWLFNFKFFADWCLSNGYKYGLEIDRVDRDKGYTPYNCRFITRRLNLKRQNKENIPTINFI